LYIDPKIRQDQTDTLSNLNLSPGSFMAKIEIYTWTYCPFCIRAKALLNRKGVTYQEYVIDGDDSAREAMSVRAGGRRSLPQIFINDRSVGGCDDLHALEKSGQLDQLLKITA
jgi:glutaredoxin 3